MIVVIVATDVVIVAEHQETTTTNDDVINGAAATCSADDDNTCTTPQSDKEVKEAFDSECQDLKEETCQMWADQGVCKEAQEYMTLYCPRSCGFCEDQKG